MGINYIFFICNDNDVDVEVGLKNVVEKIIRKIVDVFQLLMVGIWSLNGIGNVFK